MTNHVHLLIRMGQTDLGEIFKTVQSPLQKALSPGGRGLGEGGKLLEWTQYI
jgi:hypothetical protein